MEETCKVVFIAGNGRSGSTLLGTALGQMDGFFCGGEMCLLWQRYLDREWLCGCGSVLSRCELWSQVMRYAYGCEAERACLQMVAVYRKWRWLRYLCAVGYATDRRLDEFRCGAAALYDAVRRVIGCRVIVDSSKSAAYARLLQGLAGIELHPVHLVRDPRAVSFSRQRRKPVTLAPGASPRYLDVVSAARAARNWSRVVLLNHLLWRRAKGAVRVSYEDFVAQPERILQTIAKLTGEPGAGVRIQNGNHIRLRPTHTAGGNPSRLVTGDVVLRTDEEWRDRMSFLDRMIVSMTCAPVAYFMDYPLFPIRSDRGLNAVDENDRIDSSAVSTLDR